MTREEAKQLFLIIQAFAEGKTIEYYNPIEHKWEAVEDPTFGGDVEGYRIKPQPTYRPFKDAEECWNEMQKHQPFGWLIHEASMEREIITHLNWKVGYVKVDGSPTPFLMKDVFQYYTFADGEPFGVKEG